MTERITLRNRKLLAGASLLMLILVVPLSTASAKNPDIVHLKTKLSGAAINGVEPEGSANSLVNRNVSVFTVEVEHVSLAEGTVLDVSVESAGVSTSVGQITLDAEGFGELELNSRAGDTVPAIQAGDIVVVSTAEGAILSGVF